MPSGTTPTTTSCAPSCSTGTRPSPSDSSTSGRRPPLVERAVAVAERLGDYPGDAYATTKRLLRAPTLDRIDVTDGPDVAAAWSSPATMARIAAQLDRLTSRRDAGG